MFLWYIVFNRFDNRKEGVTEGQFIQRTWPGSAGLARFVLYYGIRNILVQAFVLRVKCLRGQLGHPSLTSQ